LYLFINGRMKLTVAILFALVAVALCDLYLHNPRGCNDRLNEANTNRNNANRLFDSQNNAKGGYCYGPAMTFYEKSQITVEWTTQHGCGANPKLVCNVVIQYMCGSANDDLLHMIRDGATTNTITDTEAGAQTLETNGEPTFGMHESYQYYQDCKTRDRNMGLFIADRENQGGLNAGRRSAIFTRQNNNGDRHGFECTEERDYYPYWHPSPWKDAAILAHNVNWCDFYRAESQNVKAKNYCMDPNTPDAQAEPNNEVECNQNSLTWASTPSFGIAAPECVQAPWSRENHLGNGQQVAGYNNHYNWTLPHGADEPCVANDDCNCVMRIRYNISTTEAGMTDMNNPTGGFADWTMNADNSPVTEDPVVTGPGDMELALALDTTQFGRTFQDRTFVWHLAKRPSGVPALSRIFNLNVRGKRGNIVQAYPATEYDFTPQNLMARVGDYIHFQWTGCDTNPAGNAGEGTDGTDRSNMVQMDGPWASFPATDAWILANPRKVLFQDDGLRLRMAQLDQTNCQTLSELLAANGNNNGAAEQDVRNCGKLNAASPYFDGGVVRMNRTGTFFYMSTRNHNFSNRDQKATITIVALLPNWAIGVVAAGAVLFALGAGVAVMMFYAKSNPHSSVANVFSKM